MANTKLFKRTISAIVLSAVSFLIILQGGWVFLAYLILWGGVAFFEWAALSLRVKYRVFSIVIGVAYIIITFGSCYVLRNQYPVEYLFLFFFMVAFSDMGAYAAGKSIGGPKRASKISPNKTWAGFGGALLSPALIGALFVLIFLDGNATSIFLFAALGMVLGFVGQAGDLIVSFLKRCAGAKDTGGILPGHGGILDRIDAMMLSIPVFLAFLVGLGHVFGI